jgi:hypothetical protein
MKAKYLRSKIKGFLFHKNQGIDGILVTVGLCIIALILVVVFSQSLQTFIKDIVEDLYTQAKEILDTTM